MIPQSPPSHSQDKNYQGHRARLKERFLKDFGHSMPDYEMLELLLTFVLPRRDVKPLAKELIKEYGSFANVIHASTPMLKAHKGLSDTSIIAIKLVQSAALRLLKQDSFQSGHILSSWDKLLDYCQASMSREKIEQLRILYLNRKNHLIADEVQQYGTIDHTPFYPREIVKRTLDLGASSIILVHNHPSGDATPSKEDIAATRLLKTALDALNLSLHDHIIISTTSYTSMKSQSII
jgi:DNA repair protein RadC